MGVAPTREEWAGALGRAPALCVLYGHDKSSKGKLHYRCHFRPRSPCPNGENTKGNNHFPKIPPPLTVAHDLTLMPSPQQRIGLTHFSKLLGPLDWDRDRDQERHLSRFTATAATPPPPTSARASFGTHHLTPILSSKRTPTF